MYAIGTSSSFQHTYTFDTFPLTLVIRISLHQTTLFSCYLETFINIIVLSFRLGIFIVINRW